MEPLNPDAYRDLVRQWEAINGTAADEEGDFFPIYRRAVR